MEPKAHWEHVYATKLPDSVSWFQQHADRSLRLIRQTGIPSSAAVIDVGGGASTLVDDLLDDGYSSITVLDLSAAALAAAKQRLGPRADRVTWIEADITAASLPVHAFDVWHDRAVFHFLTEPAQRAAYLRTLLGALKPGGHVVIATFAEDGPTRCSGLPVVRYSADQLHAELGPEFELLAQEREQHRTPSGSMQNFVYCCLRKLDSAPPRRNRGATMSAAP